MPRVEPTKRRRNPVFWNYLNLFLTVLIGIAGFSFVGLTFYPEWKYRNELADRLEAEQAKLRSEQLLQKKRDREVTLLQTDPSYVETIARDKLGVMKEGETIFRLDGSKKPPAEAAAPLDSKAK